MISDSAGLLRVMARGRNRTYDVQPLASLLPAPTRRALASHRVHWADVLVISKRTMSGPGNSQPTMTPPTRSPTVLATVFQLRSRVTER
jgi:hypothetical protein